MMIKPNITSHFRGVLEQIETVDGTTLYAHKSILDPGTRSCTDTPWGSFTTSTVERFLEHCYQGDYSAPKPAKLPLATPTSSDTAGDDAKRNDTNHDEADASDIEDDDAEDRIIDEASSISSFSSASDEVEDFGLSGHLNGSDYSEVFLAHAELYILSQTQGRSSLTALCLNRLREALDKAANALVRPRFAADLSRLLLYVYEHDNVKLIDDNQAHDLQNLASSCAAMCIKDIKEECGSLMRHGGKMAEDLMKGVADRAINFDRALEMERKKMAMERKEMEREKIMIRRRR
ncbi:hypothetical protein HOY80DRAFT_1021423 [Tuber brumale]|nr:hypothetical protein HOY80DRAFT_1021423 [Tuber brumale]